MSSLWKRRRSVGAEGEFLAEIVRTESFLPSSKKGEGQERMWMTEVEARSIGVNTLNDHREEEALFGREERLSSGFQGGK